MLKYLAKTANDEQPGIRTNTTICLGKIARHLGSSQRAKVLIAAFTRSLRDPFVHARNAALMALSVTAEYFSVEDCAARILPSVCPLLIDKEKLIRDQASKTVEVYLTKIRKAAASMPDTALPPESTAAGGGPRMSTPQPTESSAASWAGWAISSFTNKLSAVAGDIQSSSSPTPAANGPSIPPPKRPITTSRALSPSSASSSSTPHRQAFKSSPPASAHSAKETFFPDPEPNPNSETNDDDDDLADAWGDMDDIQDEDEENGADNAASNTTTTTTTTAATATAAKKEPKPKPAAPAPFGDGSEPDFAGWLAAQAQKKSAAKGPLPKGLAKTGSTAGAGAKKTATASAAAGGRSKVGAAAPAPAKKLDMRPKGTDDDDGWGGW